MTDQERLKEVHGLLSEWHTAHIALDSDGSGGENGLYMKRRQADADLALLDYIRREWPL